MLVVVARMTASDAPASPEPLPPASRTATTSGARSAAGLICFGLFYYRAVIIGTMSRSVALTEEVAARIAEGTLAPGAELPSLRALARERGVSVGTAARAYAALADAGAIVGSPRSRSRVAPEGHRAAAQLLAPAGTRIAGSDDLALDLLLTDGPAGIDRVGAPGSFGGLTALWRGTADAAALHLATLDGEYNAPFARRILEGRRPVLITLWHREQGIMVPPGNPEGIGDVGDLLRYRVALRPMGTGTRALLERALREQGLDPASLSGPVFTSHLEAALAVASGLAAATVGVRAAAELAGLDFVPILWEPFDVALPAGAVAALEPLLASLDDRRGRIEALGGYDLERAGEVAALGP